MRIEQVRGSLTDHYDPRSRVLRLSESTYHSNSVAAIGVAAHECGHALQDAEGYAPPVSSGTTISASQAKEIALAKVPGATVNNIYEFKQDWDDGRIEYEGSIYYSGMEYEFTIDAYSGAIREWEVESYYH